MRGRLKAPAASATTLYMTSACLLFVWKNASGLSWNFNPHSCCCSLLLPARVCTWFTRLPAVLSSADSRRYVGLLLSMGSSRSGMASRNFHTRQQAPSWKVMWLFETATGAESS